MPNDAQNRRALDEVNGKPTGQKTWMANVSGMVVAAMLVAFPGAWLLDRDRNRDMANDLAHTKKAFAEFKAKVEEFHKWPRFTKKDHKEIMGPIIDDLNDLEGDVLKLERRVDTTNERLTRISIEVAEIPQHIPFPFTEGWQNRILQNGAALAACGCGSVGVQNLNSLVKPRGMQ